MTLTCTHATGGRAIWSHASPGTCASGPCVNNGSSIAHCTTKLETDQNPSLDQDSILQLLEQGPMLMIYVHLGRIGRRKSPNVELRDGCLCSTRWLLMITCSSNIGTCSVLLRLLSRPDALTWLLMILSRCSSATFGARLLLSSLKPFGAQASDFSEITRLAGSPDSVGLLAPRIS